LKPKQHNKTELKRTYAKQGFRCLSQTQFKAFSFTNSKLIEDHWQQKQQKYGSSSTKSKRLAAAVNF